METGGCDWGMVGRSAPSMGPPPFGDGNTEEIRSAFVGTAPSMGPPPFGDGNALTVRGVALFDEPSIGPPPFGDGNVGLGRFQALGCGPSMGPPPFGDGNSRIARRQCCRQSAFNGATAFRRWKPLFVARLRHGFIKKRVFPQEPVTG